MQVRVPTRLRLHVRASSNPWEERGTAPGDAAIDAHVGIVLNAEPIVDGALLPPESASFARSSYAELEMIRDHVRREVLRKIEELASVVAEIVASRVTGLDPRVDPKFLTGGQASAASGRAR